MEKRCIKCQHMKPLDAFYAHPRMADGHLNKCKECQKAAVADRYGKTREQRQTYERERQLRPARRKQMVAASKRARKRHPERSRVYSAVAHALRTGKLVKGPCEACGTTERVQAHHDDYSQPLKVRWLCVMDHRRAENKTRF